MNFESLFSSLVYKFVCTKYVNLDPVVWWRWCVYTGPCITQWCDPRKEISRHACIWRRGLSADWMHASCLPQ